MGPGWRGTPGDLLDILCEKECVAVPAHVGKRVELIGDFGDGRDNDGHVKQHEERDKGDRGKYKP